MAPPSLQVLVVWDEASNKVRNYRIFEKVRGSEGGTGPWPQGAAGAG